MYVFMQAAITATAHYLPEKLVPNSELEKKIDTSDNWIRQRTGIHQRHIATAQENSLTIALKACERLLSQRLTKKNSITSVIVATCTPTHVMPSLACLLCAKLGIENAFALDINAACSGFVYALELANDRLQNIKEESILVVGVDTMSKIIDWNDRSTAVLFGDGAGCALVERCSNAGIIATNCGSDINGTHYLEAKYNDNIGFTSISMQGKEVFRAAVEYMSHCAEKLITESNTSLESIDWVIPHQANQRILHKVIQRLGLNSSKLISTVSQHANTSAASIPLALDIAIKNKQVQKGHRCLILAFGAGFTWGGLICDM